MKSSAHLLAICSLLCLCSCFRNPNDPPEEQAGWIMAAWEGEQFEDLDAPLEVDISNKELALKELERGRYLAQSVASCGICHAAKPSDPTSDLSGGRILHLEGVTIKAPNITPDVKTGVGGWKVGELVTAIRGSKRPDATRLIEGAHSQYSWISNHDARAISMFLLSNEPVLNEVDSEPKGYLGWNPFSGEKTVKGYVPEWKPSATAQYGRYLTHNVAGCKSCHSPKDPEPRELFSGRERKKTGFFSSLMSIGDSDNEESPQVRGVLSKERKKSSLSTFPSGGPDIRGANTIGSMVSYFRTGLTGARKEVSDPEHCPWHYYRGMSEVDKQAISYYLKGL